MHSPHDRVSYRLIRHGFVILSPTYAIMCALLKKGQVNDVQFNYFEFPFIMWNNRHYLSSTVKSDHTLFRYETMGLATIK